MILLLGGTSETPLIAAQLASAGYRVLVSQATEVPLATGLHPHVDRRSGPLDERALAELVDRRRIRAIIDAAHPYAATIHAAAMRVAASKRIPCLRFLRPAVVAAPTPGVELAPDHQAAAAAAFSRRQPVLLTTGARNLDPYVQQARRTGTPLVVRVLDHAPSRDACRRAGVPAERIIAARGPFSIDANRQHIRSFGIGVLVTKDGGVAGGTQEKLLAAHAEGCHVIVVARPAISGQEAFGEIDTLLAALAGSGAKPERGVRQRARSQSGQHGSP